MAIAVRYAVPAVGLLVACMAAGARLTARPPVDPCEATPEIHACAMFLQPEWMIRRAQAGRVAPAGPVIAQVHPDRHADIHADADTITGSITVSDRLPAMPEPEAVSAAGF